ncbi:MAG: META domain-containing protein [Bacteroidetes bacterium]|nr:META domain-containing protein [Bacteroidota bacterium]
MKIIAAICLSLLAACQTPVNNPDKKLSDSVIPTSATKPSAPDSTTLGGTWYLQPVLASDSATGKLPMLIFDLTKSKFTGNTGCNSMRGEIWFSKNDSSLSFSDKIISTKMACPGYNEPAFMKSLKSTTHYRLSNGILTLMSDNAELSRWMRKPTQPSKTLKA